MTQVGKSYHRGFLDGPVVRMYPATPGTSCNAAYKKYF